MMKVVLINSGAGCYKEFNGKEFPCDFFTYSVTDGTREYYSLEYDVIHRERGDEKILQISKTCDLRYVPEINIHWSLYKDKFSVQTVSHGDLPACCSFEFIESYKIGFEAAKALNKFYKEMCE